MISTLKYGLLRQALLMGSYTSMFNALGLNCAQVLITQHDFICPLRYGRLTATLESLATRGIVPIINENDVVTGGRGCHADGRRRRL